MSCSLSNVKSSREKVPSWRFDLSITGMCGAIFLLISQLRFAPEPQAVSAASRSGLISKQASVRAIMVFGRPNLSLTDGTGRLDIHDDADLHVDEIIVGIGEERRPSHRASPLRSRIISLRM